MRGKTYRKQASSLLSDAEEFKLDVNKEMYTSTKVRVHSEQRCTNLASKRIRRKVDLVPNIELSLWPTPSFKTN